MTQQFCRHHSGAEGERGAYLIMMTVGFIALLAVAGFAVDLALMYREKLFLQKAADGAVVAALNARIRAGAANASNAGIAGRFTDINSLRAHVIASGKEIGYANLERNKIATSYTYNGNRKDALELEYITNDSETNEPVEIVQATATSNLDFYIMDLVPMGLFEKGAKRYDNWLIDAKARGKVHRANIALVLDYSGSMGCPTNSPNSGGTDLDPQGQCFCLEPTHPERPANYPAGTCAQVAASIGSTTKIQELTLAARTFVTRFRDGFDQISIVPYNIAGEVRKSMGNAFDSQQWANEIVRLEAEVRSNTNPSDALALARMDSNGVNANGEPILAPGEPIHYVLFTDGAPTAGRITFADGKNAETQSGPLLSYKVQWVPQPANLGAWPYGSALWRWGPSKLMRPGEITFGYAAGTPPPGKGLSCGTLTNNPFGMPNRWSTLEDCLNDMSYEAGTPSSPRKAGANVPMNSPRFVEQYYNVTLSEADKIRAEQNARIFAIGLGNAPEEDRALCPAHNPGFTYVDPPGTPLKDTDCGGAIDPYQNAHKDFTRKDYFLARLALDDMAEDTSGNDISNIDFSDGSNPTGIKTWSDSINSPEFENRRGEYLPTTSAQELERLFDQIARKILLQLIG